MNAFSRFFSLGRKSGGESVIRTPRQLMEYLDARMFSSSSGVSVTPQSALSYAPVYSCVKVLSESVGQLPCRLFKRTPTGHERVDDHPVSIAIHGAPNETQTAQEFWEMSVAHLALHGNFYALINRGSPALEKVAPTLELLPLGPTSVTPMRREDRSIVYTVRLGTGDALVLPSADVLHIRAFSLDGWTGASVLTHAREALGRSLAVSEHASRFFTNNASPGGVMATEQTLSEQVYKRIKESWDERHRGVENAHRVAILEQGLKWTQVGLSAEDAQMLESQKYSRTEICGLFRVPPAMIADLERATFSNTEQQARSFIDYSLMPYFTRIEHRIWHQLLTPSEKLTHFAKFNVNALLRGDMAARANFYDVLSRNGALSPNEIREREDLNRRDGGDVYMTPANMALDGKLPSQDAPPAPKALQAPVEVRAPIDEQDVVEAVAKEVARVRASLEAQSQRSAAVLAEVVATAVERAIERAIAAQPAEETLTAVRFERDSHGSITGASFTKGSDDN